MNSDKSTAGMLTQTGLEARSDMLDGLGAPHITYEMQCVGADGQVKWTETFHNLVTRGGAADLMDKYFGNTATGTSFYIGLIGATTYTTGPAKTDTMASHGGWVETQVYSQAARPTLAWSASTTASDNVDKVASAAAAFSINGTETIKGAFVTTIATKGGATGVLYSAGTFTDRAVQSGDTLNVTPTLRLSV